MGIQERKKRDFASRRQRIISTAKNLLTQNGFNQVTLDDIAAEIEFSKGTIYNHFGSKEELYAHVLLEMLDHLLERLQAAADSASTAIEGIKYCLEAYLQFYSQHREYFHLLFFFDLFSDRYRLPEELLYEIRNRKLRCLFMLQRFIRQGIGRREIKEDLPPRRVAMILWGMGNGIINLVESGQMPKKNLTDFFYIGFDIAIEGLKYKNNPSCRI